MIELTQQQRRQVVAEEMKFQLTIMKQYLSEEDRETYIDILNKYSNLLEFEYFMNNAYANAHG